MQLVVKNAWTGSLFLIKKTKARLLRQHNPSWDDDTPGDLLAAL
jgi:hypothetical protein